MFYRGWGLEGLRAFRFKGLGVQGSGSLEFRGLLGGSWVAIRAP